MGIIFLVLVIFTVLQRLYELNISHKNIQYNKKVGGFVVKEINYVFMVILHTTWLCTLLYFALIQLNGIKQDNINFYQCVGILFFILGQVLRIHAIKTLGHRWSTRIMISPEKYIIKNGLYQFIRHPNYLGVCFEIFALPLVGNLPYVAIIFTILNGVVLFFRIPLEEKYLEKYNQENF